jgi:hypothetical protein
LNTAVRQRDVFLVLAQNPARKMMVAGVELFVMRGPDGKRQARLGRFNTTEGPVYEVRDSDLTPPRKPEPVQIRRFPAQDQQGQLRLRREGARLSYLINDATTNGTFKELFQADFGSEALTVLLFGITPGMDFKKVDGRLLDLRIDAGVRQADSVPPIVKRPEQSRAEPESPPAQPGQSVAPPRPAEPGAAQPCDAAASTHWLLFLMIGLLILSAAGGLLAFFGSSAATVKGRLPQPPHSARPLS